jgi:hypothetical protein
MARRQPGPHHSPPPALEIRTIDATNLQLRLIGKGNKERIVLLPRPILQSAPPALEDPQAPPLALSQQ